MRYNRADINSVCRAARHITTKSKTAHYVYATALGYTINKIKPSFQSYVSFYFDDGECKTKFIDLNKEL